MLICVKGLEMMCSSVMSFESSGWLRSTEEVAVHFIPAHELSSGTSSLDGVKKKLYIIWNGWQMGGCCCINHHGLALQHKSYFFVFFLPLMIISCMLYEYRREKKTSKRMHNLHNYICSLEWEKFEKVKGWNDGVYGIISAWNNAIVLVGGGGRNPVTRKRRCSLGVRSLKNKALMVV